MKQTITKSKRGNNLEIKLIIPLKTQRSNPYDPEFKEEMDNILGVIAGDEIGFAHWIDMDYKGKPDQISDLFYEFDGEEEEFKKLCKDLDIHLHEYEVCTICGEVLYGCFTIGDKGYECNEHSED